MSDNLLVGIIGNIGLLVMGALVCKYVMTRLQCSCGARVSSRAYYAIGPMFEAIVCCVSSNEFHFSPDCRLSQLSQLHIFGSSQEGWLPPGLYRLRRPRIELAPKEIPDTVMALS